MEKPILVIVLATLAGMIVAVANSGLLGADAGAIARAPNVLYHRFVAPQARAFQASEASEPGKEGAFAFCLRRSSGDGERTLRDLLEFHEHAATLDLVECLLDVSPRRFCQPEGARAAADAMEIYLWSREDSRVATTRHALAEKIHMLDRAALEGEPAVGADPFVLTWTGPRDRGLFDKLRKLAAEGYLPPGAFADSNRPELRDALRDMKPQGAACSGLAHAG